MTIIVVIYGAKRSKNASQSVFGLHFLYISKGEFVELSKPKSALACFLLFGESRPLEPCTVVFDVAPTRDKRGKARQLVFVYLA